VRCPIGRIERSEKKLQAGIRKKDAATIPRKRRGIPRENLGVVLRLKDFREGCGSYK